MKAIRAKKGGEMGVNGFQYKGGQFLPDSALTMKGSQRWSSSVEVSPVKPEAPKMDPAERDALIEALRPLVADLPIPNMRRPGCEHFSASYIFRNFRVSSEAKAILVKLNTLG